MTRAPGVERRHRLCRPSIITRDATVCVGCGSWPAWSHSITKLRDQAPP